MHLYAWLACLEVYRNRCLEQTKAVDGSIFLPTTAGYRKENRFTDSVDGCIPFCWANHKKNPTGWLYPSWFIDQLGCNHSAHIWFESWLVPAEQTQIQTVYGQLKAGHTLCRFWLVPDEPVHNYDVGGPVAPFSPNRNDLIYWKIEGAGRKSFGHLGATSICARCSGILAAVSTLGRAGNFSIYAV